MQLISVRELIYLLKKAGWQKMAQKGSHAQYRHPVRKGKITIPSHRLGNTIPLTTERRILVLSIVLRKFLQTS